MAIAGDGPLLSTLRAVPITGSKAIEILERRTTTDKVRIKDDKLEVEAFLLILSQGFSNNGAVRKEAIQFLSTIDPPSVEILNREEVVKKLTQGGEFTSWMINELTKGNTEALDVWATLIHVCGLVIHTPGNGTTILNSLLQVAEKGFKHGDNMIRKAAYKSWIVLMDNFAKDPAVLMSKKRIKLITRPLVGAISNRSEEQIRIKFDTWWHYMGLFKTDLCNFLDDIVLPFLQFCYKNIPIGVNTVTQSPAKKYDSFRSLSLEAMAILLCGLNSVKASQINISVIMDCLKDGRGVLSTTSLVDHHESIFGFVMEAFAILRYNNKSEVTQMETIIQTLGVMIKDLCLASNQANKNSVTNFLSTSLEMLSNLERQMGDGSGRQISLSLTVLDTISKLPTQILISMKMIEPPENKPLGLTMLTLILKANFVASLQANSDSDRNRFNAIFDRFVSSLWQNRNDGLAYLKDVLTLLSSTALKESHQVVLWKIVAGYFEQHLLKFGEVNQATDKTEVDVSASQYVLLFPFVVFGSAGSRQAWNQWSKLYKQIGEKAETTPLYQSLVLEDHLALNIVNKMSQKQVTSEEYFNLCCHLSESIVPSLKTQINSQVNSQDGEADLGKAKSVIKLVTYLASLAPEMLKDKQVATPIGQCFKSLCKQISSILEMPTNRKTIRELLELLAPAMTILLDSKVLSSLGAEYQSAGESLFDKAVNSIQARYDGPFNVDFLKEVQPFLLCVMSHPRTKIQNRARSLWEITWGKSLSGKNVPQEIRNCLKSGTFSDSTSSSSMESQPVVSSPTSFRSFLDRTKNDAPPVSPKFARPSPTPSAKKSPRPMISLEDENSSQFVKIVPASKKRRPLTEHQKEKLTSRSDDIPALYSEVSRDDSNLSKLPSQFDSQNLLEESSMMASDGMDIILQTTPEETGSPPDTKENEEARTSGGKRKQLHPHKVVIPPKKRGRKRKLDELESEQPPTDVASVNDPVVNQKRPRGRPKRKDESKLTESKSTSSQEVVLQEKEKATKSESPKPAESDSKSVVSPAAMIFSINSQLQPNIAQVRLTRIEVAVSPVKVVQEEPLIVVPADQPDNSVVRKINFNLSNPTELTNGHPVDWDSESDQDNDVIASSQTLESESKRSSSRRRLDKSRDNKNKTLEEESPLTLSKRSGSRRTSAIMSSQTLTPSEADKRLATPNGPESKENGVQLTRNKHGETDLHTAVKRKNMSKVIDLLDKGFMIDVKDYYGWTPLHEAVNDDPNSFAILKVLVERGADVNARSKNGRTPLHDAVQYMSQELVDYLVEKGADPNVPDEDGKSAFDIAPTRFTKLSEPQPEKIVPAPAQEEVSVVTEEPMVVEVEKERVEDEKSDKEKVEEQKSEKEKVKEQKSDKEKVAEEDFKEKDPSVSTEQSVSQPKDKETVDEVSETVDKGTTGSGLSETPTKGLVRPPLPFPANVTKIVPRQSPLARVSRGARFVAMVTAKSSDAQSPTVTSSSVELMSPKPEAEPKEPTADEDNLMTTPTQANKPWQKFAPSPMDASPSASILKRMMSEKSVEGDEPVDPPCKRRRVQFKDPPVTDQVEIPRWPSGKATRQKVNDSKSNQELFLTKKRLHLELAEAGDKAPSDSENSSIGSYESTPQISSEEVRPSPNCLYPTLTSCDEPVTSILNNLASKTWVAAAQKCLKEHGIITISDLSKLSISKARSLTGLKPPDNVTTIREALRKFEKVWNRKERERQASLPSQTVSAAAVQAPVKATEDDSMDTDEPVKKTGIASIVEESTPEEDDETMRAIYDRPSPSPTEELSKAPETCIEDPEQQSRSMSPASIIEPTATEKELPAPKPISKVKLVETLKPTSPLKAASPLNAASPVKAAPPVKAASPVKTAAPVNAAPSVKAAAPVKAAPSVKAAAPVKVTSPVKAAPPVKAASPVKAAAPVKATSPMKETSPSKSVSTTKPASASTMISPTKVATPQKTSPIKVTSPMSLAVISTLESPAKPSTSRQINSPVTPAPTTKLLDISVSTPVAEPVRKTADVSVQHCPTTKSTFAQAKPNTSSKASDATVSRVESSVQYDDDTLSVEDKKSEILTVVASFSSTDRIDLMQKILEIEKQWKEQGK